MIIIPTLNSSESMAYMVSESELIQLVVPSSSESKNLRRNDRRGPEVRCVLTRRKVPEPIFTAVPLLGAWEAIV